MILKPYLTKRKNKNKIVKTLFYEHPLNNEPHIGYVKVFHMD